AAGNSVFTTPIGSRAAYRLPDGTTMLIIMTVEGLPLDGPPAVGGEPLRAAFRAVVVDAEGRPIGAMTLPGGGTTATSPDGRRLYVADSDPYPRVVAYDFASSQ